MASAATVGVRASGEAHAASVLTVSYVGAGFPEAINSDGQIVLQSETGQSYLWTPTSPNGTSGSSIDVNPNAASTSAFGLGSQGDVVGSYQAGGTFTCMAPGAATPQSVPLSHAFLWAPDSPNGTSGSFTDVGATWFGAATNSGAQAVNSAGQIAGGYWDSSCNMHAVIWTPSGTSGSFADLAAPQASQSGTNPLSSSNTPLALNDFGQVVIQSQGNPFSPTPGPLTYYLWTPGVANGSVGTFTNLSSVGMTNIAETVGLLSNTGAVAGRNASDAAVWIPSSPNGTSGTLRDLGTLTASFPAGLGMAANSGCQVVGEAPVATPSGPVYDAFLANPGNGMWDLNTLAPQLSNTLVNARGINDSGQIIALSRTSSGDSTILVSLGEPPATGPCNTDTTPPTLNLSNMTVEATSPGGATVNYTFSPTDVDDSVASSGCTPLSGSTFPLGVTTVSCTATDQHGNTATGSFTITVVDTTPPVLGLPPNITVDATGPSGAAVTYAISATDINDTVASAGCTPASGSTFTIGTSTVSCVATDSHGNTTSGSFVVTVEGVMQQLSDLYNLLQANGAGTSLLSYIQTAETKYAAGNYSSACANLKNFISTVQAQSGKKIAASLATVYIADANRVMAVIPC